MNKELEVCPVCKKEVESWSMALSRKDNETFICSSCGVREAMEDISRRA